MDNQFYPTPPSLAKKAFAKFKNQHITRLLEPSAGRADFIEALYEEDRWGRRRMPIVDCIEIDPDNQAVLRDKKYNIVGHDFMEFTGASIYSHILMNPPFVVGVQHVLQAWKLLLNGEIVAILNAESIKNPCDKMRQFLCKLIEQHGSVEFVEDAFTTADTKRTTKVEVAIVHLEKVYNFRADFLDKLKEDRGHEIEAGPQNEVLVGNASIPNTVLQFNLAVQAAKQMAFYSQRYSHYAAGLGTALNASTNTELSESAQNATASFYSAAESFNANYIELKEKAWSVILRGTEVTKMLGSSAQKRIEAEFANICKLEFTEKNIRGFLCGLAEQQGDIQKEMLCDVFDLFGRYHHGNHVYYQGWKSNTKHRQHAFRLQMSRMVIPACKRDWYGTWGSKSLSWDDKQRFVDIDKGLAMLDGKVVGDTFGIAELFEKHFDDLRHGKRMSSDYFDVRMYAQAGTFHIYPRRRDLVDRLNYVVGKHRQWLPESRSDAPDAFWQQYDKADAINKGMKLNDRMLWRLNHGDEREKAKASAELLTMHDKAMQALKIEFHPDMLLEHRPTTAGLIEQSAA